MQLEGNKTHKTAAGSVHHQVNGQCVRLSPCIRVSQHQRALVGRIFSLVTRTEPDRANKTLQEIVPGVRSTKYILKCSLQPWPLRCEILIPHGLAGSIVTGHLCRLLTQLAEQFVHFEESPSHLSPAAQHATLRLVSFLSLFLVSHGWFSFNRFGPC